MSTVEEQELAEAEEAERREREQQELAEGDLDDDDPNDPEVELLVELTPDAELDPDDAGQNDDGQHEHQAPDRETEALLEERGKKLDKLGVYVAKKLVEIFGEEEADSLELCELCQWTHTYGWRVDATPPEPVRDAVKRAIGLGTIDEMKSYSAFDTCETCGGLGNVKTGSQVTAHLYRTCPSCAGRGYSSTLDADASRPAPVPSIAAMPVVEGGPAVEADYDMFGTPQGHPDYGKLAQHREVPISHWQSNLPQS